MMNTRELKVFGLLLGGILVSDGVRAYVNLDPIVSIVTGVGLIIYFVK